MDLSREFLKTPSPEHGSEESSKDYQSILQLKLYGSRKWNSSQAYAFYAALQEIQRDEKKIRAGACFLNLHRGSPQESWVRQCQEKYKKQAGTETIREYKKMIANSLDRLSYKILYEDFACMEEAFVFLYHCTPKLLYRLLLLELEEEGLGKALYLYDNGRHDFAYPEGLIKKAFMEWSSHIFASIPSSKIDSRLIYSRQRKMLCQNYIYLYEAAAKAQKKQKPHRNTRALMDDIWRERHNIFGVRLDAIFARFGMELYSQKAKELAHSKGSFFYYSGFDAYLLLCLVQVWGLM